MNENVEILNTLAEKFGTTVEHSTNVLLVQSNIAVVAQVTILVFLTGLMYLTYRWWKNLRNKVKEMDEGMEIEDVGLLFLITLAFILLLKSYLSLLVLMFPLSWLR